MPSVIEPLLNAIAASPFRVAPRSESDLLGIVQDRKLKLEFVDDLDVYAAYEPSTALVRLGTPYLETLWAASHAFIVIFDEYEKANKCGEEFYQVGATLRSRAAYALYRELLVAHAARVRCAWSQPQLAPVQFPEPGTDRHVTNELFLTAVSWVIHHEIAHARLGHQEVRANSVLEESEADRSATDWLCQDSADPGPVFKRGLGVACANIHLLDYDLQLKRVRWTTHPPTYERLGRNLDRMGFDSSHKVYAFGFVLLEILLAEHGIALEVNRDESFHDMLATACLTVRGLGAA